MNWRRVGWLPIMVLSVLVVAQGCASHKLTEAQEYARDAKRTEDRELWRRCKELYDRYNKPTTSKHDHRGEHDIWEIREDIATNQCRAIIKSMDR